MSTWKNIHTDPPMMEPDPSNPGWKKSAELLATDGTNVYTGFFWTDGECLSFRGQSAEDRQDDSAMWTYENLFTDTDGWQWMPTTVPEREKTADEMFAELGYERRPGIGEYKKPGRNRANGDGTVIRVNVSVKGGFISKFGYGPRNGMHNFALTAKECMACARKIEEMEANK